MNTDTVGAAAAVVAAGAAVYGITAKPFSREWRRRRAAARQWKIYRDGLPAIPGVFDGLPPADQRMRSVEEKIGTVLENQGILNRNMERVMNHLGLPPADR